MLSYLSLRLTAGRPLAPSPMDDTSGMAIAAARGARSPNESTNPVGHRPATAESDPGPLSDISDDATADPLVKE